MAFTGFPQMSYTIARVAYFGLRDKWRDWIPTIEEIYITRKGLARKFDTNIP